MVPDPSFHKHGSWLLEYLNDLPKSWLATKMGWGLDSLFLKITVSFIFLVSKWITVTNSVIKMMHFFHQERYIRLKKTVSHWEALMKGTN